MTDSWDQSSRDEFVEYYAQQSASPGAVARGERTRDLLLQFREYHGHSVDQLRVLDVGCNAGAFSFPWAQSGHTVVGIDINERLISLADERARQAQLDVSFEVGSATDLPVQDGTFDVCMAPELLEHVEEWERCLDEFSRVLKPDGTLYLTTTNRLCPKQQEFDIPFYSWFPGRAKRHIEHLAVTTRPELANYATYPAVNWFSFYQLSAEFNKRGLAAWDRFDLMSIKGLTPLQRLVSAAMTNSSPLRFVGHVLTPSTIIVGSKTAGS